MVYFLNKFKVYIILLCIGIFLLIYQYISWNNQVISKNEYKEYFSNFEVTSNVIDIRIPSAQYNSLRKSFDTLIPDYITYQMSTTKRILSLDVTITLLPNIPVLKDMYHTDYEAYLKVIDKLTSSGIIQNKNFTEEELYVPNN